MKLVIYTAIVGGYDQLPDYKNFNPLFDYICFSNDFKEKSKIGIWSIRNIPKVSDNNIRLSRFPKINPHLLLPEYDYSIWIDGNINIKDQSIYNSFIEEINKGLKWMGVYHPRRNCAYEEIRHCIQVNKGGVWDNLFLTQFLKKNQFPQSIGLYENNLILRHHKDPEVQAICNEWWNLYLRYTVRDQPSLPFVFWKYNFKPSLFLPKGINVEGDSRFEYNRHYFSKGESLFFLRYFRTGLIKTLIQLNLI